MPLLFAYRRWWCFAFIGLLLLPTLGLVMPDLKAPIRTVQTVPPAWWIQATERLDPYINNNYGFRGLFMGAHAAYSKFMKSTRERPVLIGQKGQIFYTGEKALDQSLGRIFRTDQVERLVHVTDRMRDVLKARGITFAMVVPPNGQSVMPDLLPAWAQSEQKRPTEYDSVAATLPARGTAFADLRPELTAAREEGPVYRRTDTHWNNRGAVLGFNAAMRAAGRPELQVPESEALGPLTPTATGDLARYLGETSDTGDLDYPPKGPMVQPANLKPLPGLMPATRGNDPFEGYAYETGHPGPRILVIGDSFSQSFWPGLLARNASAFGWTHHRNCRFEWSVIDRFKPDIVIYAPVERAITCLGSPAGLDMK